jgi:threonyl-tRNA synthetase
LDYAKEVQTELRKNGLEATLDQRPEKIGKKIRDTELRKVPYMLVVGEKEAADRAVAIRRQGQGDQGVKPLGDFVAQVLEEVADYK